MQKLIFVISFALLTVLGVSAQDYEKSYFEAVSNVRLGYAGIASSSDSHLKGGFDFGFNILEAGVRPYRNGQISLGADLNLDFFNAAESYYFLSAAHKTAIAPSMGVFNKVRSSRLEALTFGFPLNFTNTFGEKLKVTIGASARINLDAGTYVNYLSATEDPTTTSVSGIKTKRFSYDVHLAVSYDGFGIYASYVPMKYFENGYGPDFNFFTVGVIIINDYAD
ncbi:MAG: hypothetical protein II613_00320 [Bacteroidales bacterium]|jgi:hypothetical protein|nr:hypothetical protein [Bacteroidales bacterium]